MGLLRVLLVEDHPTLQQAIKTFLSEHCCVVGILATAEEILATINALQPEVLVLDISLPGRSGLQVLPEIRKTFPTLGIVIATNHAHPLYRSEALKRGADRFVWKNELRMELWPAIQAAHLAHA